MPNKDTTYILRTTQPPVFRRAMKHQLGLETKAEIVRHLTLQLEQWCTEIIDHQLGKGE